MSAAESGSEGGGYGWSGTLGQTDVRTLYDRLADLRLSGLLELHDGDKSAQIAFVGGDPVETLGTDSREVRSWRQGSFRVTQRVPDLAGALTDGVRLTGVLLDTRPRELIRHCEDARLTADLELERTGGERALVRFAHGHVERTEVNGKPELSAMAMIDGWLEGRYVISLRPLFADDAPRTPPPQLRGGPAPGQLFDFTAPVQLGDRDEVIPHRGKPAPGLVPDSRDLIESVDSPTMERPMAGDSTAITKPLPPPPRGARRVAAPPPPADADATSSIRNPGSRLPMAILIGLGALVALGVAAFFVLPRLGIKLPGKFFSQGEPAKPIPPAFDEPSVPPPPVVPDKPPVVAGKEKDKPPVKPPAGRDRTRPTVERPEAVQRLIDKGRRLLVEGHSHTALDTFKAAHRLAQKDTLIDLLERMAQGKTGKCELVLDGNGTLVVDGKAIKAPKKLKLPAGSHTVGAGADVEDFLVGKGEKKHLKASN